MKIKDWKIIETKLDQETFLENNTIFSLSNGYFGVRGSLDEEINLNDNEAVFINGFYDEENFSYPNSSIAQAKKRQKMLFAPMATKTNFLINGKSLTPIDSANYCREIDLKSSILKKTYTQKIDNVEVNLKSERIVSLFSENLMIQKYEIEVFSDCHLDIISLPTYFKEFIDGKHLSRKTRLSKKNPLLLKNTLLENDFVKLVEFNTDESNLNLHFGVKFKFDLKPNKQEFGKYSFFLKKNQKLVIEKFVYYNWLDHSNDNFENLLNSNFEFYKTEQLKIFDEFWKYNDIEIKNNEELQAAMRFNIFSLFQNVGKIGKVNICAKGLTGEGYDGHYFWDTEIFVLPFFSFTTPVIAKSLLLYRYNLLKFAKERASELGYNGALYPWRTINGKEASPFFPAGTAQIHINADIAYALIQYVEVTDDKQFLVDFGYEMLKEIALFYMSYIDFNKDKGYMFNMVTGPDEYTALVNNNSYTNLMVKFLFEKIIEYSQNTNYFEEIISKLKEIILNIYIPRSKNNNLLIEQSEGFLEKSFWPFGFSKKPLLSYYHPMVIYKYQITKQADLILAMNLLPQYFSEEEFKINYDYYEKITTHDSSLSKCSYSQLASHLKYYDQAYEFFFENVKTDLFNTHRNTADGVHIASQAGSWQAIVFGFAGLRVTNNKVFFENNLPKQIEEIKFKVKIKNRLLEVTINQKELIVKNILGEKLDIFIDNIETKV